MPHTLVGVFDDYRDAQRAVDALASKGFRKSDTRINAYRSEEAGGAGDSARSPEAAHGGFFETLGHFFASMFGVSEPPLDSQYYLEAVRRGAAVVTLDLQNDDQVDDARRVLDDCGAIDVEERAAYWKQSGWAGYDPGAEPYTPQDIEAERQAIAASLGARANRPGSARSYPRG